MLSRVAILAFILATDLLNSSTELLNAFTLFLREDALSDTEPNIFAMLVRASLTSGATGGV